MKRFFFSFVLFFFGFAFCRPSWLLPPSLVVDTVANAVGSSSSSKPVRAKTVRDTVFVRDTVEKTRVDTLYIPPPKELRYKYKLQICNLDYDRIVSTKIDLYDYKFKDILGNLNSEEKAKNCYFSSAYSDSNYVYSYGIENVRTNGYIYDNYGNKLEQTEKILTGITLSVKGDKVTFDYLENKKLMLHNSFNDNEVNFYADYTLFERRCNFWVFCNFMERKQYIFLNLTREEVL